MPSHRAFDEVEGQLTQQGVQGLFDQSGESGPMGVMMKMADSIVLFDDVLNFRDGLVPFFLIGCQPGTSCGLSHAAVIDLVKIQEFPVLLSIVALVGENLLDDLVWHDNCWQRRGENRGCHGPKLESFP